jgi:hypothetical protein
MLKRLYPWLLAITTVAVFFFANWNIVGPSLYPDEGGYLGYAAGLAGFWKDAATSYGAGYSILLVPAFLRGGEPATVYMYIKLANSIMWGITALTLYGVLQLVFPTISQKKRLGITAVSLFYPAWIVWSGYVLSESAFILFYTLSVYFALRVIKNGGSFWLLWAVSLGYLFVIHQKSIVVLGSAIFISVLIVKNRRDWRWLILFLSLVIVIVVLNNSFFTPWLTSRMTTGDYPPSSHYSSLSGYLRALSNVDANRLETIGVTLSGHIMYIGLATFGLVFYPFLVILKKVQQNWGGNVYASLFVHNNPVFFYIILSFVTTLLLSVIHFSLSGYNVETYMYGRYVEGVSLPLIALGLKFVRRKYIFFTILITGITALILSLRVSEAGYISGLKIPGFWQDVFWPDNGPLVWWAGGVIPLLLLVLFKSNIWRFGIIIVISSSIMYLQITRHYSRIQYQSESEEFAYIIREAYAPGTCVAFDFGPGNEILRSWLHNSFYLYDYDYKRLKLENWYEICDGPLISPSSNLNERFNNVFPMAVDKNGLYLWDDVDEINKIFWGEFDGKALSISPESFATRFILREGWHEIESWGVWSSRKAEILFPKPAECLGKINCDLVLSFRVLEASSTNPITVFANIDGAQVGVWVITSEEIQTGVIPLVNEKSKLVHLVILVPDATSPQELGLNNDSRELGIGLVGLKLAEGEALNEEK